MDLVILDHETYYDQEYSLRKMSTEEYVTDPRFESMLTSIKINDQPPIWHSGTTDEITDWLHSHGVGQAAVVCHNHMFDGLVNTIHHKLNPPMMLCTMFMAKALLSPFVRSVSLDGCLKHLQLGVSKGTYVHNMKGRSRLSLDKSELRDYASYCMSDVEGTYELFKNLAKRIPREEFDIMDMTLRMYLDPQLIADPDTFEQVMLDERVRKEKLLAKLPADILRADLMSNIKFAQVLEKYGVEPPLKISPTTGKETFAFAKNDTEWKDLEEELADDPVLAPILAARLGAKSTLAETRAERMMSIGNRFRKFRVPLMYYAAHTGRYGGTQKINPQNFTRVNPKKLDGLGKLSRAQLRFGLKAPKHHVVLAPDLSQIEARGNAWLAGCTVLLTAFTNKIDVYSSFASEVYARPITKENNPKERFIGKTCILGLGYGMGAPKLRATLRKDNVLISEAEALDFVHTYRHLYHQIPHLWRYCDSVIDTLVNGGGKMRIGPCLAAKGRIELPNGMNIVYNKLKYVSTKKYDGWTYEFAGRVRTLWGGKIVENIVQSLARIKIMDSMRQIKKELGYRPVLQAHDELVYMVLEKDADALRAEMLRIMCLRPAWAPDLPLAAEAANYGPTYGDAK